MADHSGWYPPGQVCYPPELPPYLKNVYDLKPIVGVPSDTDVIGIHSVILAANRVSGVPGMHDPGLLMGLADHLFGAQMAKYRSKYSLITFPSNATYTPPELPAHISVKLEPVSGAPSDEEIMRAQEALRSCQQFSHVPSMFDTHVNMELSQHLFDLQMARYMRLAGENPSNPLPQPTERTEIPVRAVERSLNTAEQLSDATNNAGTGAITAPPPVSGPDVRELIDRSNQLAERFNVLLERSNELVERCNQPTHQPDSQASDERFNQVLERLTQLEQSHRQTEQSDRLTERFNQLFERFNQLIEQASLPTQRSNELAERSNQLAARASQLAEQLNQLSDERFNQLLQRLTRVEQSHRQTEQSDRLTGRFNQLFERFNQLVGQACLPAQRANELAEQSNQLAARANQLAELLIQSSERSNTLSEQGNRSWRRLEVVMGNVNKVLMRIQHAIVRNHRGNTISALDCLVNEKGETHATSGTLPENFREAMQTFSHRPNYRLPVVIDGANHDAYVSDLLLDSYLRFYGINNGVSSDGTSIILTEGRYLDARRQLSQYLTSCLG